MIYGKDVNDD